MSGPCTSAFRTAFCRTGGSTLNSGVSFSRSSVGFAARFSAQVPQHSGHSSRVPSQAIKAPQTGSSSSPRLGGPLTLVVGGTIVANLALANMYKNGYSPSMPIPAQVHAGRP